VASDNPGDHITLFDITPASPSSASLVHIVGRARYFSDFRSMRFVIGNQVMEMTNFVQVGDQMEISADWDTTQQSRGDHAIAFEVAKNGDPDWVSAERRVKIYTLTGDPAPNNHPPERPLLLSPYNWYLKDASGASALVQMCVNPSSDPDGNQVYYYFETYSNEHGYSNSGWITGTCWEPTLQPGQYSWRVKAGDLTADSDWSQDTWNFTVAKGGVYIGDIAFFQQNTNDTHLCVFVTYDGIQGPEVYAWINYAPDGSDTGEWHLLDHYGPNAPPDCTQSNYHGFWIRSPSFESGTHLIRINAVKRDSGANATKTTTYTIDYIKPPDPLPLSPSSDRNNGTWWNTPTIHFEWGSALRADTYTLRLSTYSDPFTDPNPVFEQTVDAATTSLDYTFTQDYPQLYWKARANNAVGYGDSPGNVWFGIDRVIPTCQVQPLPEKVYENVFQVSWAGTDDSSGIRSFDIQYQDSGRDEWRDWQVGQPSSKTYDLFTGQPGHTYYFRCRATENAGNLGSYPGEADTFTMIDPASRPPTVWWDGAYAFKRNITVLNNMPDVNLPANYPVHIRFDDTTVPTAAELYNASQSAQKCDDLRIVFNNETEINRVVLVCSSTAIDIWFRTQVSIPAGTSEDISHQLYVGNANPGTPPANPSQVWYPLLEGDTTNLYFFEEGSGSIIYDYR
jgi:hypothetical protein